MFHATMSNLAIYRSTAERNIAKNRIETAHTNYNATSSVRFSNTFPTRTLCFPSHTPRVAFLLPKRFSTKLATGAEAFLTLLIRFVGEAEAGGTWPAWMRALAMEIMQGCVFFISLWLVLLRLIEYTLRAFRLCGVTEFMRITLGSPSAQITSDAAGFDSVCLSTVGFTPGQQKVIPVYWISEERAPLFSG